MWRGPINRRIQLRVVVHLELPIELEVTSSALNIAPQGRQTFGEVLPLPKKYFKPFTVALNVRPLNISALHLLARVKDLQ